MKKNKGREEQENFTLRRHLNVVIKEENQFSIERIFQLHQAAQENGRTHGVERLSWKSFV